MAGHLQKEIRQKKPFTTLEQEVHLNVVRTAGALMQKTAELLRRFDLTSAQYNVLRILRGAGEGGLPSSEIGERLLTRDPDVTRLIDRMEKRGFVERGRSSPDRRVVTVRITTEGLKLVNQLDDPITKVHREQLGHMGKSEMKALIDLLEKARGEGDRTED